MEPRFDSLLLSAIVFSALLLIFIYKRFGFANAIAFLIITGGFSAIMDFLSAYVEVNYEYPGKSKRWVFTFILFGWTAIAGSCLLVAEQLLTRKNEDLLNKKSLWWKAPILTAVLAVLLDMFIDPIAVETGYWVWFVKGEIYYYEIPLLNFVGWFVLMLCASMAWIFIIRQKKWRTWQRLLVSFTAIIPLAILSGLLSTLLRSILDYWDLK
jgi:uncharacterized membrane protein